MTVLPAMAAWHAGPAIARGVVMDPATSDPGLRVGLTDPAAPNRLLQEGFAIGNGRLAALLGGSPNRTELRLSESSLWLGTDNDALDEQGQFPYDRQRFGSFLLLARLSLTLPGHDMETLEQYNRVLDLARGRVEVSYRRHGIAYRQLAYASHPDDVVILELSGDAGALYDGAVRIDDAQGTPTLATADRLSFRGELSNQLHYAACARVAVEGGSIRAEQGSLHFCGARTVTICIGGLTNYAPDAASGFRDPSLDPEREAGERTGRALGKGALSLRRRHEYDHRALFDAMSLDLGQSTSKQRELDIATRLARRARPGAMPDPELDLLYFQFGRYLTIAGSRGRIPTNLQGLWLVDNNPPWRADYHTDINLEMNYWLPDRAALPACSSALADYCIAQHPSWEKLTRRHFNDPKNRFRNSSGRIAGWTVAMSLNIHGGLGWRWQPASNAWLCNALWNHYEYTRDTDYLQRIYPLLRGACAFWQARLIEIDVTLPDGRDAAMLVDDRDWSPEQGPDDALGISYAQELVWALFENFRKASSLRGEDIAFAAEIAELQRRLYLPAISEATGALEEWMTPDDLGTPAHRHLSPLIGLFPGDRINTGESPPAVIAAARRLLERRGMDHIGWGNAWRACCWARLKDAEKAYQLVVSNLAPFEGRSGGTAVNLLNTCVLPPNSGAYENEKATHSLDEINPDDGSLIFQVDANFGTPAAMAEMLLYSRPGYIELLPAIPVAWSDKGSARGLPARGGFVVDMAWRRGRVTRATLSSEKGGDTLVAANGKTKRLSIRPGEHLSII